MHILDFANEATTIQAVFEDWFETTITEPSDPNLLYTKQREVMDYELLVASELEAFIRVLATAGPGRIPDAAERKLHAALHEYLKPPLDRFTALDTDDERTASEAHCRTSCVPTASSRRSSTGATGTWSGSTSTAGSC